MLIINTNSENEKLNDIKLYILGENEISTYIVKFCGVVKDYSYDSN